MCRRNINSSNSLVDVFVICVGLSRIGSVIRHSFCIEITIENNMMFTKYCEMFSRHKYVTLRFCFFFLNSKFSKPCYALQMVLAGVKKITGDKQNIILNIMFVLY